MKERLRALIEQKIAKWQRDGVYENIYAISLYVFDEEEIGRAFGEVLIGVVREIHASGLLKSKFGRELPILIHGLEYDGETARLNLEANGEALGEDFPAFCGAEQKEESGESRKEQARGIPKTKREKKPDIPRKFNCGEQKADMRHVMAFILIVLFVLFTTGIYDIITNGPDTAPDVGQNGQPAAKDGAAPRPTETQERLAETGSEEGAETAMEPTRAEKPGV